ncbi:MAG: hypothetical protein M1828_006405 [Chrysothrix sp. TS-e1954]|nr:MAG: hypothetical protein M1828_006405 [Chrysothrix sp. TS-e1954]
MLSGRSSGTPGTEDRGPTIQAISWSLGILSTILLFLRIYTRLRVSAQDTAALVWAIVAWALTVTSQVVGAFAIKYGLGQHMNAVEQSGEVGNFLLWSWIAIFIFHVYVPLGKVAAASFLIAVHAGARQCPELFIEDFADFPTYQDPKRRYLLHFIAYSNVILEIPNWFIIWFSCSPPSALWNPLEQEKCHVIWNVNYSIFLGSWQATSDFVLALLPIYLIWPLQMDRKVKLGLCCLMGLGVFAAVCTIMRTIYTPQIMAKDVSYVVSNLIMWGAAEQWIVLIAISVPPTWPLFRPLALRTLSKLSRHKKSETPRQKLQIAHLGIVEDARSSFFQERSHLKDAISLSSFPTQPKQAFHTKEEMDPFTDDAQMNVPRDTSKQLD